MEVCLARTPAAMLSSALVIVCLWHPQLHQTRELIGFNFSRVLAQLRRTANRRASISAGCQSTMQQCSPEQIALDRKPGTKTKQSIQVQFQNKKKYFVFTAYSISLCYSYGNSYVHTKDKRYHKAAGICSFVSMN